MPGVAFTKEGHRLGRGMGFYDTYIQKCSMLTTGRPMLIALAFKEQILDEVPFDTHDEIVDMVLYEDASGESL